VRGGYIIKIKPIANGILVVPLLNEFINSGVSGMKYPMATPIAMAKKIQRVRYRSKNFNFGCMFIQL
jgi:hypothetical protein